jgi:septum formation protein
LTSSFADSLRLLRPLILASASPQRRTLLTELAERGAPAEPFEIEAADVDETPPPGPLAEAVRAIARRKAAAVAARRERGTVIAADTVIDLDGELLGKPRDAADARAMLARLGGREHRVHTGVALAHRPSGRALDGVDSTTVRFRALSPEEIARYVASGEPFGKSGSYAIQGGAKPFVARIDGALDNVVGLPLALVRALLGELAAALARG